MEIDKLTHSHKGRTQLLDSHREFDEIACDYKSLLDLSYDARYTRKCSKEKVKDAMTCLENIESNLKYLIPTA